MRCCPSGHTTGRGTGASSASTWPCAAPSRWPTCSSATASWKCFDLAADPTWRTEVTDPAVVLPEAQAMLTWRSCHAERTWTSLHLGPHRLGRWPEHLVADPAV